MKRLGLALTLIGLCVGIGACDGTRGLTEPAGRLQNIGTSGSGLRDSTLVATTQENGGTSGSGHREKVDGNSTGGGTAQSSGSTVAWPDDEIKLENGGTIGSGH